MPGVYPYLGQRWLREREQERDGREGEHETRSLHCNEWFGPACGQVKNDKIY